MKEWMKALEKTRILAPADIRYLFFVWKLWPFEVENPVRAIFTIIIRGASKQIFGKSSVGILSQRGGRGSEPIQLL